MLKTGQTLGFPDYFNLKEGKISREEIAKLSCSHLQYAYKYWLRKQEKWIKKENSVLSPNSLLLLSVLIVSLRKEIERRKKRVLEVSESNII